MIGDPQTLDYCQELIAGIDDNSNGEVDFRELVGMLSKREKLRKAKLEIVEAFRMLSRSAVLQHNDSAEARITHTSLCAQLRSAGLDDLKDDIPHVATGMLEFANRVFELADADGDGLLDKDELRQLMEKKMARPLSEAEVDAAMAAMDSDSSGKVDVAELRRWLSAHNQNPVSDVCCFECFEVMLLKLEEIESANAWGDIMMVAVGGTIAGMPAGATEGVGCVDCDEMDV